MRCSCNRDIPIDHYNSEILYLLTVISFLVISFLTISFFCEESCAFLLFHPFIILHHISHFVPSSSSSFLFSLSFSTLPSSSPLFSPFLFSFLSFSQVYWDSLWSAAIELRHHRCMYEHGIKHAGVWGISTFLYDGQVIRDSCHISSLFLSSFPTSIFATYTLCVILQQPGIRC